MKKWIACLCALLLIISGAQALAAGVTIRTFTPFADMDIASQGYMDLVTAWEEETGNMVEDYSGVTDEEWMARLEDMVRAGEADVVIVPLGTGLTYEDLVTVEELMEAAPTLGARRFASMAAADGSVLLTPVRLNWEALYINLDVLERCGLSTPTTYEELVAVCSALSQQGVTPISNALCEWSEIVLDCLALAAAPSEAYGSEASLNAAQQQLAALSAVGAFGEDAWNVTDAQAESLFLTGEAAMRIDADTLAQVVPEDRLDSVIVIPFPTRSGEEQTLLAGTPCFGLGITRACWEDDDRCEAALSFASTLLTGDAFVSVTAGVNGALGESIADMVNATTDCSGVLYDVLGEALIDWEEAAVSALMSAQP